MLNNIKSYFNGSMEPEPEHASPHPETDLCIAAKTFHTFGIIAIVASLVLFPAIGFQITILLFGIMFIGMSILMKSQDEILHKISDKGNPHDKEFHEAEESIDKR